MCEIGFNKSNGGGRGWGIERTEQKLSYWSCMMGIQRFIILFFYIFEIFQDEKIIIQEGKKERKREGGREEGIIWTIQKEQSKLPPPATATNKN